MIDILCVGNPELTGDSIGPRVGTLLSQRCCGPANIIGTIDDPVMASNYDTQIKRLRQGATVIVVDAAIGYAVGDIEISKGGMVPGEAVRRRRRKAIGDYNIKIVTGEYIYKLFDFPECRAEALATQVAELLCRILQQK